MQNFLSRESSTKSGKNRRRPAVRTLMESLEPRQLLSATIPTDYVAIGSKSIDLRNSGVTTTSINLQAGSQYILKVTGTGYIASGRRADADFMQGTTTQVNWQDNANLDPLADIGLEMGYGSSAAKVVWTHDGIGGQVHGYDTPTSQDAGHAYEYRFTAATNGNLALKFFDLPGMYGDNSGSIYVVALEKTAGNLAIHVDGVADAEKDAAAGIPIHINDNFDLGQTGSLLGITYAKADNLPDSSGNFHIDPSDGDLKKATISIGPAGATGALTWTIPSNIKVWWKSGTNWVQVANDSSFVATGDPADLRIEGMTPGAGTIKASFQTAGGAVSFDEIKVNIFTGFVVKGRDAASLVGQLSNATGWILNKDASGNVWRTYGSNAPLARQTAARPFVDTIFKSSVPTVETTRTAPGIVIGSFVSSVIDTTDIAAIPDLQVRAATLMHEVYEQYQKQVKGLDFAAAHALALTADNAVMGSTSRTDADPVEGMSLTPHSVVIFSYTYNMAGGSSVIFRFTVNQTDDTISNVRITR